ncbi:hypothetical protein GWI33_019145 [Rhynchophorus ferrugineus]|uniref:Carboxylic ester hydrolase n=1 Tax=Rhynchophorus ferrugineus TaxID=354439 RepID=A0A834M0S2_RHYFE|nr:hypothetical protein GWI33_019145 [Rhynchophorus ferrugineus]
MMNLLWCERTLFIIFLSNIPALAQRESDGPTVQVPQGLIKGTYEKSYRNRTYSAFEGIPFAKPPIGNLRFQAPVSADAWNGTLKANKKYECLQFIPFSLFFGPRGTEDCLYIYVYVPREIINSNELLDVVVHIHGGAFMLGSPKFMAGPEFLMDKDIVYVSFNYRLNSLGFLSTGDDVIPGNNGLKDQVLAMEWIKDNIKFFGGNPTSITLTGLSAGAASVHYHYLSPLSKGLFHRGLSQSGTALQHWSLKLNPLDDAKILAKNLSCPTSSSQKILDCLRECDGNALMNATISFYKHVDGIPFNIFGPVIEPRSENAFISEHPYKIMENGNIYDVPWITSNTKDEGLFPVGFILWLKKLRLLDEQWYDIMPYIIETNNKLDKNTEHDVLSKIKTFYFKDKPLTEENIHSLIDLFTERLFLTDAEEAIKMHTAAVRSEVYYYSFSYILKMPSFPPSKVKGTSHGDDTRLLLGMIGTPSKLQDNDEQMMELFTEFLAEYAQKGIPKFNDVEWLPQDRHVDKLNILYINNVNDIEMRTVDKLGFSDFWNSLPLLQVERTVSYSTVLKCSFVLNVLSLLILFL